MNTFTTADLYDENEALLSCVDPIFNHFGKKKVFQENHPL
jgi:regulator of ribonuclease activity A